MALAYCSDHVHFDLVVRDDFVGDAFYGYGPVQEITEGKGRVRSAIASKSGVQH